MRRIPHQVLGLSILFTAFSKTVWASTQIPEPASIGGFVLGIGVAGLILLSRRKK